MENVKNPISRLIYGTAISQMIKGEDAHSILDAAYEAGITTFDTARSYEDSEASLGNWINQRGIREKVNIITKGCNPDMTGIQFSPDSLKKELKDSLEYLQTDYIDLYCLHRDDTKIDVEVFVCPRLSIFLNL
jgi:aryl-alcohol dehydrogenase-like predicted oxidoreductase